ncbi:MAG: glycosyltransferase [Chloroflexota bacterium]|nr:glycosyltransferase [Chloroflexota bacterium]
MPMPPLVSVIVPVKNSARYLAEALDSIARQTYRPIEIIVVDGHSTDGTPVIARDFPYPVDIRVQVLTQPHDGLTEALNFGIALSSGALLAFLSSDDRWLPDKLTAQVVALQVEPTQSMVITHMRAFAAEDYAAKGGQQARLLGRIYAALLLETVLVRRTVFDDVGLLDTSYILSADADWFARAIDKGHTHIILSEVLVEKRLHEQNLSNQIDLVQTELLRTLRASAVRRRRTP